jgi:hypothetical protein
MIETKTKLFDTKKRIAVVITDCTLNNLAVLLKAFQSAYNQYGELSFCYVCTDKNRKREEISLPEGVHLFHTTHDTNFFKAIKNQELKQSFLQIEHDILLCSYFEKNKSVNKFIIAKKARLKVGIEKESLPKFDVSFLIKSENHNEFIDLSLKYLKLL